MTAVMEETSSAVPDTLAGMKTPLSPEQGASEDLSLCFVCLRWTAGDPECRPGHVCELQRALQQDSRP
ncbi:MAG TPA: hypothetical protein VLY24_10450 [Bryobacteraceae bacterium]|nr:hypothetical protein [Bryobacteraceae bacterium]